MAGWEIKIKCGYRNCEFGTFYLNKREMWVSTVKVLTTTVSKSLSWLKGLFIFF